jgi:hypothetical protein
MSRIIGPNGNGMPAQQVVTMATPFNDTQLVAMIAAHYPDGGPQEAVDWAMEIVAESIVQMKGGRAMTKLVEEKQKLLDQG